MRINFTKTKFKRFITKNERVINVNRCVTPILFEQHRSLYWLSVSLQGFRSVTSIRRVLMRKRKANGSQAIIKLKGV